MDFTHQLWVISFLISHHRYTGVKSGEYLSAMLYGYQNKMYKYETNKPLKNN